MWPQDRYETSPQGGIWGNMSAVEDLDIQAERLRGAGALGRSPVVHRLFDYLLERSREEPAPKETEVAEAVFGRRPGFDVSQDSTVRV